MRAPEDVKLVLLAAVVACTGVAIFAMGGLMTLAAVTVTGAAVGLLFVRQIVRHRRLTRALLLTTRPERLVGLAARVGHIGGAAFAAGLTRPTIFCDERLTATLSGEELRAIVLHERAHQQARDPLRTAALAAVAPFVGPLPAGAAWLERRAARREIAADRFALEHGASRAAIASALLKVDRLDPAVVPGFASAVDLRLNALLDEEPEVAPRWGHAARLMAAGALTAGVICLLLLHPWAATSVVACC